MNPRLASVARRLVLLAVCLAALAGLIAACKQQEGDRCQLDSDCEGDLVCNEATQQCASENASEPIDANTPDFVDSELDPDAPDDVMPDA